MKLQSFSQSQQNDQILSVNLSLQSQDRVDVTRSVFNIDQLNDIEFLFSIISVLVLQDFTSHVN